MEENVELVQLAFNSYDDVARKVISDLAPKGVTETQVREKMNELLAVAVAQIQSQ